MVEGIHVSPLSYQSGVGIHLRKGEEGSCKQGCAFALISIVNLDNILEGLFVGVAKLADFIGKVDQILMPAAVDNEPIHGLNIKLVNQAPPVKLQSLMNIPTQNRYAHIGR